MSDDQGISSDGTFSCGDTQDAAAADLSQQLLENKYRIIGLINNGGMGLIYRAIQLGLVERVVAIKTILPCYVANEDAVKRFEREVRLLALLDHPNLIRVFDSGRDSRLGPFVVMPAVEGLTLEAFNERCRRAGTLPKMDVVVEIALNMARGLNYLHHSGIVFRDVKPSNVLLPKSGAPVAVVIDLGIGRLIDDKEGFTGTDVFVGTPSYASPEQLERRRDVGAPSDWYSLGLVVLEALTGRHPLKGINRRTSAAEVSFLPIRLFRPDMPEALSELVGRLTAYRPEERACGAEVVERLERLGRSLS